MALEISLSLLKSIPAKIKKILWFLGLHAFGLILLFFIFELFLAGLIFYKYVFLAEKEEPQITESILKFDEAKYQSVLKRIEEKEQQNQLP